MSTLTQKQRDFLKQEEEALNAKFTEPAYVDYKIKYVKSPKNADVTISNQHNIFDYLAIGLVSLAKEIKDGPKKKVVYAIHKEYPTIQEVLLADKLSPPKFGAKSLCTNALSEVIDEPVLILQKYFNEEKYSSFVAGILMYTTVTTTVMGYTENPGITLEFKNFNDTISAQKLAFETLKKLTISNCLGSLCALLCGED